MKESDKYTSSRRRFIQQAGTLLGGAVVLNACAAGARSSLRADGTKVNAHIWVYASKFPPAWDATPVLDQVFADLSYAGMDGVELMENMLRYDDSVDRIRGLVKRYSLPVAGTSYGIGFHLWDQLQHKKILNDIRVVVPRLHQVGGKKLGISVGAARRLKTEEELDAQASVLKEIMVISSDNGIEVNLHNHTYEVENEMHDLGGTLARLPDIKLGPDLNWLIRAGVDPVDFINRYGKQIVYLHLRDQYADGRWTEYLGQGATDFGAIEKALKEQKFGGDVAIELAFEKDFVPANPLKEDWKLSRGFVRQTFGW